MGRAGAPRGLTPVHHGPVGPATVDPSETNLTRAGVSRLRLLRALREATTDAGAGTGLGVQELAERTGLHVNTVRAHLDRLVADGAVQRHSQPRAVPGRPRLAFTATPRPDAQADSRSYRLLAEMLTGMVTSTVPDARQASVDAGRAWGRYLVERPAPDRSTDEAQAVQALLSTLGEVGFSPELSEHDATRRTVLLRHCPFLEVAEAHRDVVCSMHLGLMQGALAELRAPVTADRLEPLVAPSLCRAHLTDAAAPHPAVGVGQEQ